MKTASDITIETGKRVVQAGCEAAEFVSNVRNSAKEGVAAARQAVKKGLRATEDVLDDTAHRVKKNPLQSVAITFGVGIGAGILIGWLVGRRR